MASEKLVTLTEGNFAAEVLESTTPVLVDFWAAWCGPCKMIAPIVEELATEYDGKIKIGKLDVDDNNTTAMKYQVMSIPTLILFKEGEVVETLVGLRSEQDLTDKINYYLNS